MSDQQPQPQPTTVTLEDAYREACTALGEAMVRERFLTRTLEQPTETAPDASA